MGLLTLFGKPSEAAPAPARRQSGRPKGTVTRITATIDGREVQAAGLRWSSVVGGYHRASLRIPERAARRIDVGQGSILKLWQQDGRPVWEGRLALRPNYRLGAAVLEANGYKVEAEKAHGRLLYQTRDLSLWGDATLPPHSYAVPTNQISIASAPSNGLTLTVTNPTGSSRIYGALIAAWFPGTVISRYAFSTQVRSAAQSIEVSRATGPSGARTTIATHGSGDIDQTVTNGQDMLVMKISLTVAATTDAMFTIFNLRVNGAGTTTDTLFTADLVTDVGQRLGWDVAGVKPSALNVMPLDISGGSWATSALDFAGALDDRQWRVLDDDGAGPRLQYTPWEREWKVSQADGALAGDLLPLEAFNRVDVVYADDVGTERRVTKDVSPDPLDGRYTNSLEVIVPGKQKNVALATEIAEVLAAEVGRERWAGSVSITKLVGAGTPHDIVAGDILTITDWDQREGKKLRVTSVDASPSGVGVALEDTSSASSLLARAGLVDAALGPASPFPRAATEPADPWEHPRWRKPPRRRRRRIIIYPKPRRVILRARER